MLVLGVCFSVWFLYLLAKACPLLSASGFFCFVFWLVLEVPLIFVSATCFVLVLFLSGHSTSRCTQQHQVDCNTVEVVRMAEGPGPNKIILLVVALRYINTLLYPNMWPIYSIPSVMTWLHQNNAFLAFSLDFFYSTHVLYTWQIAHFREQSRISEVIHAHCTDVWYCTFCTCISSFSNGSSRYEYFAVMLHFGCFDSCMHATHSSGF